MSFFQFYQQGGLFMHFITLCGVVGAVATVQGLRGRSVERSRSLRTGMVVGALALGALGMLFGFMEMGAALLTVPKKMWADALVRGGSVAITPMVYGLVVMVPLQIIGTIADWRGRPAVAD